MQGHKMNTGGFASRGYQGSGATGGLRISLFGRTTYSSGRTRVSPSTNHWHLIHDQPVKAQLLHNVLEFVEFNRLLNVAVDV